MPSLASAQTAPYVESLLLRNGNDAGEYRRGEDGRDRPRDQVYPGSEQSQIVQLANNEILIFGMGSYRLNGELPNNRMQMFCASVKMDPIVGPQLQSMSYVTNNNGDRRRNANHVRATGIFHDAAGRPEVAAVTYNYAPNNRAQAYQVVFGPGCEQLSERTRIMAKNNDDCSETGESPEMVAYQDGTTARLFSAHGCNGNGEDDSWAALVDISKNVDGTYTVDLINDDIRTEREEERSRPDVLALGDYAVVCLTAGNTQPPNRGVYCSAYDTASGERLWRTAVARKEDGIYRTQIRMNAVLDSAGQPTNTVYTTWREITQRNRRGKGAAKMMGTALRFSRDGMDMLGVPQEDVFPSGDATHPSQCSTQWGTDGVAMSKGFIISGSINGSASALSTGHIVSWDEASRTVVHERKVGLNAAIDTGWLSNIYGNNPNTQGRNFIKCIGDVKNPGYGVTGGYQPDVKSFVAVSAHTRRMDLALGLPEEKLALELVLVPAVTAPDAPELPEPDEGDTTPPDDDTTPPDDDTDPTPPDTSSPGSLGGCSVSGNTSGTGSFLLLGLAVFAITRRRRRS
jgi:MYXO-CTERM domain-containing protein